MISQEHLREQAIDRFWETIPPVWSMVRSHIRSTATVRFDITVEQFHILRYVRRGKDSMRELATARNISRPAISQAVDVLVRKRLVTRIQSTTDRRYVELSLTETGIALLDAVFQETRVWMKERMKSLSAEELGTLIIAMGSLKKMME